MAGFRECIAELPEARQRKRPRGRRRAALAAALRLYCPAALARTGISPRRQSLRIEITTWPVPNESRSHDRTIGRADRLFRSWLPRPNPFGRSGTANARTRASHFVDGRASRLLPACRTGAG